MHAAAQLRHVHHAAQQVGDFIHALQRQQRRRLGQQSNHMLFAKRMRAPSQRHPVCWLLNSAAEHAQLRVPCSGAEISSRHRRIADMAGRQIAWHYSSLQSAAEGGETRGPRMPPRLRSRQTEAGGNMDSCENWSGVCTAPEHIHG